MICPYDLSGWWLENLVTDLQADECGEGDLSAYPSDAVAQALRERLIIVVPCQRHGKNIRLTRRGKQWEKNKK